MLIRTFTGARPIIQPFNLSDGAASSCEDCFFHSTGLDPLRASLLVREGVDDAKTLYRIDGDLIALRDEVDIVKSPVIGDIYDRLYFTIVGKQGYFASTQTDFKQEAIIGRDLSQLVPPETAVGVSLIGDGVVDKYTSIRVSFVTDWGEETALSPASGEIGYVDDDQHGLNLSAIPVSAYQWVVKRRIYMAVEGEYYRIAEIDNNADTSYSINPLIDDDIGDIQETDTFDPAPSNLRCLTGLPNGVMAGVIDEGDSSVICFSEPYQPHAWPTTYRKKSYYKAVALAAVPEGLLVLTEGDHVLVAGATPDVMSDHRIESNEPCLSKRSLVMVGGVAFWACPDGVAVFGGQQVTVISRKTWSREQWQGLQPKTMLFSVYEDHLLIYSNAGAWIYSLERNDISDLSETGVQASYYDVEVDKLYHVRNSTIVAFNEGEHLLAKWYSKHYVIAGSAAFSSARVVAEDYGVELRLWANSVLRFVKSVTSDQVFRLKSTGRKRQLVISLFTDKRVDSVQLVRDMREIR